ncbi:MAG: PAS domain-containing protein [Actinomycetota bacterium]
MTDDHTQALDELAGHLAPIFESSPDGVYIWIDEQHKTCNEKLAEMFGTTVEEWRAAPTFLESFVTEEDRGMFSYNYWNRIVPLAYPATFRFRGIRKDGTIFPAETDMIPLTYRGHTVAYHFVRRTG